MMLVSSEERPRKQGEDSGQRMGRPPWGSFTLELTTEFTLRPCFTAPTLSVQLFPALCWWEEVIINFSKELFYRSGDLCKYKWRERKDSVRNNSRSLHPEKGRSPRRRGPPSLRGPFEIRPPTGLWGAVPGPEACGKRRCLLQVWPELMILSWGYREGVSQAACLTGSYTGLPGIWGPRPLPCSSALYAWVTGTLVTSHPDLGASQRRRSPQQALRWWRKGRWYRNCEDHKPEPTAQQPWECLPPHLGPWVGPGGRRQLSPADFQGRLRKLW